MQSDKLIKALISENKSSIVSTSWEIIFLTDTDILDLMSSQLDQISQQVMSLPKSTKPSLRDYRYVPNLALKVLFFHNEGKCRCRLYHSIDCLHAVDEEKYGFIQILDKSQSECGDMVYSCRCNRCETKLSSNYNGNYHYPTSSWKEMGEK